MRKIIDLWQFYFEKFRSIFLQAPVHRDYLGRSKLISGKLRQSLSNRYTDCSVCMKCDSVCPTGAILIKAKDFSDDEEVPISSNGHNFEKDLLSFHLDYSRCISCGDCVDICPTRSLQFSSKALPVSSAPEELKLDLVFQARKNRKLGGQLASKFN